MNKKQLVQQILEQMEREHIGLDDYTLRAEGWYWERYPDGHCKSLWNPSIEETLACLTEESLQKIVDSWPTKQSPKFSELWMEWGRAGYFQCEPTIISSGKVPILRIRHDSYLHWMRGYCFQNSYDAHCNGSNGGSGNCLQNDITAITLSEYSEQYPSVIKWEAKWAVFRKAMVIQHPFLACGGHKSFHSMLGKHSDIFEQFVNETDDAVMHLNLDQNLTLDEMRHACSTPVYTGPTVLELALVWKDECFGVLRFSEQDVQLSWCDNGTARSYVIQFPKFDKSTYFRELRDIGDTCTPAQLSERDYLYHVWTGLSVTLMTLAGVSVSAGVCCPSYNRDAFDTTTAIMFDHGNCVSGMQEIWVKCNNASLAYADREALVAEYTNA